MSVIQLMTFEVEARRVITRARKVTRKAARARGENTRRLCTCCPRHILIQLAERRPVRLVAIAAGIVLDLHVIHVI